MRRRTSRGMHFKDFMLSGSDDREQPTPSRRAMTRPRGRPPAGYRCVGGAFEHLETGDPFDAALHAALAHAKKLARLKAHYWERGGRAARLRRYVCKRKPKACQLTLLGPRPSGALATPSPEAPSGPAAEVRARRSTSRPDRVPHAPSLVELLDHLRISLHRPTKRLDVVDAAAQA